MNDKTLTIAEHLETADDLAIAAYHIDRIVKRVRKHFPKTHEVSRTLECLEYARPTGTMSKLHSLLSDKFETAATDEDIREHGRIYANLKERYEKLTR